MLTLAGTVRLGLPMADLIQLNGAQVLLVVGWAVIGLGVAVLVRSQAFALALLLTVPYAVEPTIRSVGAVSGHERLAKLAGLLPFSAGSAMTDVSSAGSSTLLAPAVSRVHPLAGAAVFVTSIAILASIAVARFRRQDV